MSKKTRVILIIIAVPIFLILAVAVGLKLYFTSDRLKALVIPKVEEQIHRNVIVDKIALRIIPRLSLQLSDLSVSNPEGVAFDKDEFLSLEKLILDVNLTPLLRKEVQVNEITLLRPRICLQVTSEGVANFSMVETEGEPKEKPGEPEKPQAASTFALSVSDVDIIDAEIEYIDRKADQRVVVSGYNQHLAVKITDGGQNVYLTSQASADGISYGSIKSFLISNLPFTAYQRLSFHQEQDRLSLDSVQVGIRDIALVLKGTVANVQTAPILDLSVNSTRADIEQLLSLVPEEFLKDAEGLSSSGTFQFAMAVKGAAGESKKPAVTGTFTIDNGRLSYPDLPKSITDINVSGSFSQSAASGKQPGIGKLTVDKFSASLGSSRLNGKLSVVNFDDPWISATFKGGINLGEVKEYYPIEGDLELGGALTCDLTLDGKASDPTRLKAAGSLDFKNVYAKSPAMARPVRGINGSISFNRQAIEARNFNMKIGKSDLAMDFTMRNYLGLILEDATKKGKPHASLKLTSKLLRTSDLVPKGEAASKDGGEASAKPGGMIFPDISADINANVDRLVMEKYEFSKVRGSAKLRDRVLNLQNFSLNAFQGSVKTNGRLDYSDMEKTPFDLNLNINNVQANAMLPHFTSFGQQMHGAFTMSGSLKGALNDTLGLDPGTLNGGGSVTIRQGRIVGYPLMASLAQFTGISELRELQFANWTGTMKIADGRIILSETKITSRDNEFILNGSQGFDGSMDYKLRIKIPEKQVAQLKISGLAADLLKYLKDDQGRVNLDLLVRGTTQNPSIGLDQKQIEDAAKKALEEKAQEELKKLEEEAKDKIEDALKDLLGP